MNIYCRALSIFTLAGMAACSGDSPAGETPLPEEAIAFSAPLVVEEQQDASRAKLIRGNLELGSEFGVLGYCIPLKLKYSSVTDYEPTGGVSDWSTKKSLITPDVMYKSRLRVGEHGCYYSDGNPGLWYTTGNPIIKDSPVNPEQFRYTFIAYHPYASRFTVTPDGENGVGAPTLTYTVIYGHSDDPHNNGDGTSDDRIERHPEATTDALFAITRDHVRSSGAVELEFRHILCGLSLQLNNYSPDKEVTVNSVTVSGAFYKSIDIDCSQPDPVMTPRQEKYWGTFQFLATSGEGATRTPVPVTIAPETPVIAGATPEKPEGTIILLVPNLSEGDGRYLGTDKVITVDYTYDGVRTSKTISPFNLGRQPKSGVVYKLNINFLGDQILLMLTADDVEYWTPGSNNDIIIN